jgi:hypothetical protein
MEGSPQSLLTDIYAHIFTLSHFRLSDIINLSVVSNNLRQLSLRENNWYIICDTKKILYNFIRKIFRSGSNISYPFGKIKYMRSTNYRDRFNYDGLDYPELLEIMIGSQADIIKFYEYFTDYEYLYVYGNNHVNLFDRKIARGVNMNIYRSGDPSIHKKIASKHAITEIYAPVYTIECIDLSYYPLLERLEANNYGNPHFLKQTRLKYLRHNDNANINMIIPNLPDTIESLIMFTMESVAPYLDYLSTFKYLNYLKTNLVCNELSTTLNVYTIHFIIPASSKSDIRLDLPNIKNIIISGGSCTYNVQKLYLTSQNAITCLIVNIKIKNLITVLPNCSNIVISNDVICGDYDSDIFSLKN